MPALPKRRWSTSRQGKRRGAIKIKPPRLVVCSHCGASIRPHLVCPECGYYQNRPIIIKPTKEPKETKKTPIIKTHENR